jgi:hypothetical protein
MLWWMVVFAWRLFTIAASLGKKNKTQKDKLPFHTESASSDLERGNSCELIEGTLHNKGKSFCNVK